MQEEREKLRHFSHQHFLIPLYRKHKHDGHDFFCYACNKGIEDAPTYYGCKSCKLYLHKSCAEINHRFHKYSLALRQTNSAGRQCDGCGKLFKGFAYSCESCNFNVDLECALLPRRLLKFAGRMHHLTFFEKLYDNPKCMVSCSFTSPDHAAYFRCVRCNFNVHVSFSQLSSKAGDEVNVSSSEKCS